MNYLAHYDHLIARARTRTLEGYSEKHHVVPRCMGGRDVADNLVRLTPEEHFVAHQLLVKLHPHHPGVVHAAVAMTFHSTGMRVCNKLFGWLRRRHSIALKNMSEAGRAKLSSLQMGNKRGQGHKVGEKVMSMMLGNRRFLGHKHTAEWCAEQSKFRHAPETKTKMSADRVGNRHALGHKDTPEQSTRKSIAQKARRAREKALRTTEQPALAGVSLRREHWPG